jgi:hypothetical protein
MISGITGNASTTLLSSFFKSLGIYLHSARRGNPPGFCTVSSAGAVVRRAFSVWTPNRVEQHSGGSERHHGIPDHVLRSVCHLLQRPHLRSVPVRAMADWRLVRIVFRDLPLAVARLAFDRIDFAARLHRLPHLREARSFASWAGVLSYLRRHVSAHGFPSLRG